MVICVDTNLSECRFNCRNVRIMSEMAQKGSFSPPQKISLNQTVRHTYYHLS